MKCKNIGNGESGEMDEKEVMVYLKKLPGKSEVNLKRKSRIIIAYSPFKFLNWHH